MEDDFSAPKLRDFDPPRVFATVTSKAVSYNMDFVEYLMGQETARRFASGMPKMTLDQESDFRRELIAKVIIQQNPEAAVALRSEAPAVAAPTTTRQQLNG